MNLPDVQWLVVERQQRHSEETLEILLAVANLPQLLSLAHWPSGHILPEWYKHNKLRVKTIIYSLAATELNFTYDSSNIVVNLYNFYRLYIDQLYLVLLFKFITTGIGLICICIHTQSGSYYTDLMLDTFAYESVYSRTIIFIDSALSSSASEFK